MKHFLRISLVSALSWAAAPTHAQVPQLLNYQGRVTVGGTNFSGAGQFKFALVNAAGTTNYWSHDGTASGQPITGVPLPVASGLYSVLLGDTTVTGMGAPITSAAFSASDVRLRVWFNDGTTGFQQLTPDQRIAAVGYALVAANVDPTADLRGQRLLIGSAHRLSGLRSTIAGGYLHDATNDYATVPGGLGNIAGGLGSTVCGGMTSTATGAQATIAGGQWNWVTGMLATVSGGYANAASGTEATVAGGEYNGAYGNVSTIGGGYGNLATGYASTVPGGYANLAAGQYSFAAGAGAVATNDGAFVWADASSTNAVRSAANNQFTARCTGGVRFFTSAANANVGAQLLPGAGSWSSTSDRKLKENVKSVDTRAVLAKLVATPVTEWNLVTQDPGIRHIGPMAQDFKASFGVGEDDRHISTTDADGVAFAAIQGLHQLVQAKDDRITELENRLRSLELRLQPLDHRLHPNPVSETESK